MNKRAISRVTAVIIIIVIIIIAAGVTVFLTQLTPTTTTPTTKMPTEKRKLYVSHWGFGWDLIDKLVIKPFEEEYNVEIILISGTTSERYTKLVKGVEPIPDVIFLPDYYAYRAIQQGLLIRLDLSKLQNYQYIYDFIREQLPSCLLYTSPSPRD